MSADIAQHLKSTGIKCFVWIHLDTFIITDLSYSLFGNAESRLGIGKRMKWSFLYILIMRLLYGHNITSYQVNAGNWLKERADFVEYLTCFFQIVFFLLYEWLWSIQGSFINYSSEGEKNSKFSLPYIHLNVYIVATFLEVLHLKKLLLIKSIFQHKKYIYMR